MLLNLAVGGFVTLKRRNARDLPELYVLGWISGVFLRSEAPLKGRAILPLPCLNLQFCRFRVTKKDLFSS